MRRLRSIKLKPLRVRVPLSVRRGLATSSAATQPAVQKSGKWSFGLQPIPGFTRPQSLVDMVMGRSTMPSVPLNVPAYTLPPRPEPNPSANVKVTRLPNGVKVATREFQTPIASVGVFVQSGSRDETPETAGISHFLETAAFASTRTRTDFRLIRDMGRMGASLSVNAGREGIAYTGEVLANWTRPVIETLGDIIKRPAFIDFELRDLVNHYREEAEEREHKHDVNLFEHVHGAAYGYSTLGSPLFAPLSNLKAFKSPEVLNQFWLPSLTGDRVTIVAVGVPHDIVAELAAQEFEELPAGGAPREAAQYVGGDVRMHASPFSHSPYDKNNTHLALAWKSAAKGTTESLAFGLLSAVLGSDKPLLSSAAQPAVRALNTRLNSRILARGLASRATSFVAPYSDSGLFGVYAVSEPSEAAALSNAVLAEVATLANSTVGDEELARAKLALTHAVLHAADSRTALLNDIGCQVMRTGTATTPQQTAAAIAALTAADVQKAATAALQSPLTVAASGDLSRLPRYDQFVAQLK